MAEILRYSLSNPRRLPTGYTPVAYIESTGSEYIDTGLKDQDMTIELKIVPITFDDHNFFGGANYLGAFGTNISGMAWVSEVMSPDYLFKVNNKYLIELILKLQESGIQYEFKVDGDSKQIGSNTLTSYASYTLYLFTNGSSKTFYGKYRLYSAKYYTNTLIRNFIPCYSSEKSAYGLFDIVSQSFFENKGTGAFIGGPEVRVLPEEYLLVEYILSSDYGGEYINTKITPTNATRLITTVQLNSSKSASHFLFGSRTSGKAESFYLYWDSYTELTSLYGNYNSLGNQFVGTPIKSPYTIDFNANVVKLDGITVKTFTSGTFTGTNNIFLFGINTAGSIDTSQKGGMRIFNCQIYLNGTTLNRDMIPCYRRSDMKPGMYDVVNQVFYTNSGTGEFVLGPTIELSGNLLEWNLTGASGINYLTGDITTEQTGIYTSSNIFIDYDYNPIILSFTLTDKDGNDKSSNMEFTFSADVKGSVAGIRTDFYFRNSKGSAYADSDSLSTTTEYKRLYYHITGNPKQMVKCRFRITSAGTVYIKNVRLQPGNVEEPFLLNSTGFPTNLHSSTANPSSNTNFGSTDFSDNSACVGIQNLPTFTSISISFWMKPANTSSTLCILNYRNAIGEDLAVFLISGNIRFDVGGQTIFTTYTYTTEWQHVALTYNQSKKCLYVNGELQESINKTTAISCTATKGTIGVSSTNTLSGNGDNIYSGLLYDLRIFDTVLTEDEIKQIYANK